MAGFSRVSRVRISARIRVRFSFIGATLYIAMAPHKLMNEAIHRASPVQKYTFTGYTQG